MGEKDKSEDIVDFIEKEYYIGELVTDPKKREVFLKEIFEFQNKILKQNIINANTEDSIQFKEKIEKLTLTAKLIDRMNEILERPEFLSKKKTPTFWFINKYIFPVFQKLFIKLIEYESNFFLLNSKINFLAKKIDKIIGE